MKERYTSKILKKMQLSYQRIDGSFSMQNAIKPFEPYSIANKRTEKPMCHVSLTPSPKDNLTDEEFREIADNNTSLSSAGCFF